MTKGSHHLGRLEKVINKIEDPDLKEIVKKVIDVEISYRSTERAYFPWKKIRDIIDDAANLMESKKESIES